MVFGTLFSRVSATLTPAATRVMGASIRSPATKLVAAAGVTGITSFTIAHSASNDIPDLVAIRGMVSSSPHTRP